MGLRAMKVLFKVTIIVVLLILGTSISAGSIWDGSVSTARYGYLPQTGMYAASNAFPKNSRVTVTNPDTGKAVDVLVLERLEDNNLFLVLSAEAAESIGIEFGDIFYGNISEKENISSFREDELPFNPDPDVNPSADSKDYSELALIQEYIDTELGGSDNSLLISDITDPIETIPHPDVTELVEEPKVEEIIIDPVTEVEPVTTAESEPEIVEEPVIVQDDIPTVDNMPIEEVYVSEPDDILTAPELVEAAPNSEDSIPELIEGVEKDTPLIAGMTADAPVFVVPVDISGVIPELPSPESDIPVVSSMNSEVSEEIENDITPIKLPELPIINAEVVEDEIPTAVAMVSDIAPLEEAGDISYLLPELVKNIDDDMPEITNELDISENLEMEVEVVLEPADDRPPVIPDETEIVEAEEITPVSAESIITESVVSYPAEVVDIEESLVEVTGNFTVTKVLSEDSYYLQIGVYREEYSALDLAGRLGVTYPVTVLVSESPDTLNYKVMVGPLKQDESGAVLYSFKSTGYPDAFLRKGL